ncbi:MAG: hypothetical protein JNK64_14350 [Myxococcales bacterium]|nr:hypothetical protein [Myxococcales bacterium]
MRSLLIGVLTVAAFPAAAVAGPWYYEWSCTGRCAPGQLAISGREGPFDSREDCEYARAHDARSDEFVSEGNLGGLEFCEEDTTGNHAPTGGAAVGGGGAPPRPARMSQIEVGVAFGPGWQATTADGGTTVGAGTLGLDIETHTGKDVGGGALLFGIHATRVEAAMLGADARSVVTMPLLVGIDLTPAVAGGKGWQVRVDLGASIGGFLLAGCGDCPGAVWDETLGFGYSLKAGVDVYLSKDSGVSLDLIVPRWEIGDTSPGNLRLDSPVWLVRASMVGRPANP